jgi:hypothetical protein
MHLCPYQSQVHSVICRSELKQAECLYSVKETLIKSTPKEAQTL